MAGLSDEKESGETKVGTSDARSACILFLQGMLIGLGAVLPGVSGGVMCVVFGVYGIVMSLLSEPFRTMKREYKTIIPLVLGGCCGFAAVAKALGFLLDRYPDQSVCLFVGLISGMMPGLYKEAGKNGRNKYSFISLAVCFAVVLALLIGMGFVCAEITPNFFWYIFCGFCVAVSVIAPGLSFSTLLMPLGLYTPLVTGIGALDFGVLLPVGIGALATVAVLARAVNRLMKLHYSVAFHGILGVVTAATIVIIPFKSFAAGAAPCIVNIVCLATGVICALVLDRLNGKVSVPER